MIKLHDTLFFQIRAPGGHDTTFIISTYTINQVKYNNYFITNNHVLFHALLRWYKQKQAFGFLLFLCVFFVNFARKVSLEIFDKNRPK